jgi:hypothetical protein
LLYEAEFAALGTSLHEMLDLQRVDPTYHLVFDDGSKLALTSDMKSLQEQLEAFRTRQFSRPAALYGGRTSSLPSGDRETGQPRFPQGLRILQGFKTSHCSAKLKPLANHYRNMSAYFDDPRLKAAFTFQDVYMGLSPFRGAGYIFDDALHRTGARRLVSPRRDVFHRRGAGRAGARAGVEFEFDALGGADRCEREASPRRGPERWPHIQADAVLANADLPYVYNDLLPQDGQAERLARKRFSCSVISFFWGVDKTYHSFPRIHSFWRTIIARTSTRSSGTWTCRPTPAFISMPRPGSTRPWRPRDRIP